MGEHKNKIYSQVMQEKEEQILAMLKEYKVNRSMTTETGENISGHEVTERLFKNIAAEEGQLDAINVKSLRLTKKRFKAFLQKLYNSKMADKIVNMFDFVNPLDIQGFVKQVEDIFIRASVHHETSGRHLKILGFQFYDMNLDSAVCEFDMYSSIKSCNDELFIYAMHQDFKDMHTKFQVKQFVFANNNQAYEEWNYLKNNFKIRDIEKYLKEKKKISAIKENFLQVFNTKTTGGKANNESQMQAMVDNSGEGGAEEANI